MLKRRLYCGGSFCFDCRQEDYIERAASDYRSIILGGAHKLLQKSEGVALRDGLWYIGPFYFETEGMEDREIVKSESEMIRSCTDAIFLLDDGLCPGTIAELIFASSLQKRIHVFYIKKSGDEETESSLRSPCWYPIILSEQMSEGVSVCACSGMDEARNEIKTLIESL